jgi:hypothetical protein
MRLMLSWPERLPSEASVRWADGLDYDDETLARFDIVQASPTPACPARAVTAGRLVRSCNLHVRSLTPAWSALLRSGGRRLDMDAVFAAAAECDAARSPNPTV